MDVIIASFSWQLTLLSLETIVVFSEYRQDDIEQVGHILQLMRNAGLNLNL